MKKLGAFMILFGILCVLVFILYTIGTQPEVPFLIKLGIMTALIGVIIVIFSLVYERILKKRKEDEDDFSKY